MRGRSLLAVFVAALLLLSAAPVFAAGPCSIYKTFSTGGSFTAADANSIQTVIGQTNAVFSCLDDYSASVAQMQTTVDPYPSGTESLPTTGQGELERLRYQIREIHGRIYWYQDPSPLNPPGDIQFGVANSRSALAVFYHASSGFVTSFQAGQATADAAYVWPLAPPTSGTQAMVATAAGVMSWNALTVANGFTGATSFTANGVLYGAGTSAIAATAQGGTNTILIASAGAPSFSSTPIINTSVQVGVPSTTTGVVKLGHASSALMTTFQAGANTEDNTYVWPTDGGSSGQVLTTDGATPTTTLSWSTNGLAASQAEMESASSTTVFTSPGRTQYHPGVAKAIGMILLNGTVEGSSYNISSVADSGAGTATVTMSTAVNTTGSVYLCTTRETSGSSKICSVQQTNSTVFILVALNDVGGAADPGYGYSVAVFGDQ